MIYTDKKSTRITELTITKTILVYNTEELVINLRQLLSADLGLIKIPEFDFSYTTNEVTIESEYIKGIYPHIYHMDFIKQQLVDRESEWSFSDYTYTNFKVHRYTEEIYAIDLDDFCKVSISDRKASWQNAYNLALEVMKHGEDYVIHHPQQLTL